MRDEFESELSNSLMLFVRCKLDDWSLVIDIGRVSSFRFLCKFLILIDLRLGWDIFGNFFFWIILRAF